MDGDLDEIVEELIEELEKISNSNKFMAKRYTCLITKSPKFNSNISDIT